MKHQVYILTSNSNEAYIMLRKTYMTLDWLIEKSFSNDERYEKKNPVLSRFCRENFKTLTLTKDNLNIEFLSLKEVLDYRQKLIEQYEADGFIVLDDKHYDLFEKSANENFGEILKRINIKDLVKKYGQEALIEARKTLTVGEFLETFS